MSEPSPGRDYISGVGDTFRSIAVRAYGLFDRESLLRRSNPSISEPITTGSSIIIPFLAEGVRSQGAPGVDVDSDQITLIIGDIEVKVLSIQIAKFVDEMTFGWSAKTKWLFGEDKDLDKVFTPYTYPFASLYIGKKLVVGGILYDVDPTLSIQQSIMEMKGYSFAADVMDSSVDPPYEVNNISLEDRANQLINQFGIEVEFDVDSGGIFDRVTADRNEKIGDHLLSLATQRGILVSSTPSGNLLFTDTSSAVNMGRIQEGDPVALGWGAGYKGRNRFHSYRVFSQSPFNNSLDASSVDIGVPRARSKNFVVEDVTEGNIQKTADWKKNRELTKAFSISLTVKGWFAPNGDLWEEGNKITINAPSIFINNDFEFLIKGIIFELNEGAKTTVLTLVPPQLFTGEDIVEPWKSEN